MSVKANHRCVNKYFFQYDLQRLAVITQVGGAKREEVKFDITKSRKHILLT